MIGGVINGVEEPWTLGYLIDVILTRDPWMHRLDICDALDRDAGADRRSRRRHRRRRGQRMGRPARKDFTLHLTGPAGGTWTAGPEVRSSSSTPSASAG